MENTPFLPPSFSIETKSWQKHQSLSDSKNLAELNNVNKNFSQENPPKKSSQKTPPKNFSQKIPLKKFFKKSSKNNPLEKFQKNSKRNYYKHRTWRSKSFSSLFILIFFQNKIPHPVEYVFRLKWQHLWRFVTLATRKRQHGNEEKQKFPCM